MFHTKLFVSLLGLLAATIQAAGPLQDREVANSGLCTCYTASVTLQTLPCPTYSTTCSGIQPPCAQSATLIPPHNKHCPTTKTETFYSTACPPAPTCPFCPTTVATITGCTPRPTVTVTTTTGAIPCASFSGCTTENCIVLSTVTESAPSTPTCGCAKDAVTKTRTKNVNPTCPTACPPLACATQTTTVTASAVTLY